jgi:hypothetical protein
MDSWPRPVTHHRLQVSDNSCVGMPTGIDVQAVTPRDSTVEPISPAASWQVICAHNAPHRTDMYQPPITGRSMTLLCSQAHLIGSRRHAPGDHGGRSTADLESEDRLFGKVPERPCRHRRTNRDDGCASRPSCGWRRVPAAHLRTRLGDEPVRHHGMSNLDMRTLKHRPRLLRATTSRLPKRSSQYMLRLDATVPRVG